MRQAIIKRNHILARKLTELDNGEYLLEYDESYVKNHPNQIIVFNMPEVNRPYKSKRLFPFFDGLMFV
jgi:serine/threonine-protein kinase HipA